MATLASLYFYHLFFLFFLFESSSDFLSNFDGNHLFSCMKVKVHPSNFDGQLSPPPPGGTNWAAWLDILGREMYLWRALEKLDLELLGELEG